MTTSTSYRGYTISGNLQDDLSIFDLLGDFVEKVPDMDTAKEHIDQWVENRSYPGKRP